MAYIGEAEMMAKHQAFDAMRGRPNGTLNGAGQEQPRQGVEAFRNIAVMFEHTLGLVARVEGLQYRVTGDGGANKIQGASTGGVPVQPGMPPVQPGMPSLALLLMSATQTVESINARLEEAIARIESFI